MIELEINNNSYNVPMGDMVIQACSRAGIDVPRFCFHEKLTIAGNCRMCLVEIGYPKSLKPIASCAMPIINGMKIFTETYLVKKARESVLEFLLANHPLDCPICDQGGECDLQDETLLFGNDRGRFYESKRSIEDKECGPLIKTVMTRCIQCTRCVRYFSEITGYDFFGTLGRGSFMEIGTFIEKGIDSEISGNVIDLCPVGALTSKPYAFNARPWELRSFQTIDILDSFGSSIRIDVRGTEIVRILPLLNTLNNEEWISDKIRFTYDGLKRQRLQVPIIQINKMFVNISWKKMLNLLINILKYFKNGKNLILNNFFNKNSPQYSKITGIAGKLSDIESLVFFKDFLNNEGSSNFSSEIIVKTNNIDFRSSFIAFRIMKTWDDILKKSDIFLFINFNPRLEMPIFNIKVRRSFIDNNIMILNLGPINYLNYFNIQIGNSIKDFLNLIEGKNLFSRKLLNVKYPLVLYKKFNSYFSNDFFNSINLLKKYIKLYKEDWMGVHLMNEYVGNINSSEVGFISNCSLKILENNILYCMGAELKGLKKSFLKRVFLIYQGSNGDNSILNSDVILPTMAFTEKITYFLNFEGLVQKTKNILRGPGMSKLDYEIFFGLILERTSSNYKDNFLLQEVHYNEKNVFNKRLKDISPHILINKNFFDIKDSFYLKIKTKFSIFIYYNIFMSEKFSLFLDNSISKSSQILTLVERRLYTFQNNFIKIYV
jgi:NADH dehydrogenase (ubiquinone) Fe-S protein 1